VVQGREIIANLSKAAGLATMIAAMRPDIDNIDEYVRNTTARAFSVVASALGIPALLPFLKAVCQSKKSWQVRARLLPAIFTGYPLAASSFCGLILPAPLFAGAFCGCSEHGPPLWLVPAGCLFPSHSVQH